MRSHLLTQAYLIHIYVFHEIHIELFNDTIVYIMNGRETVLQKSMDTSKQ
jgi:uncharacterized protein YlzI (FlbEa/FlbD family)